MAVERRTSSDVSVELHVGHRAGDWIEVRDRKTGYVVSEVVPLRDLDRAQRDPVSYGRVVQRRHLAEFDVDHEQRTLRLRPWRPLRLIRAACVAAAFVVATACTCGVLGGGASVRDRAESDRGEVSSTVHGWSDEQLRSWALSALVNVPEIEAQIYYRMEDRALVDGVTKATLLLETPRFDRSGRPRIQVIAAERYLRAMAKRFGNDGVLEVIERDAPKFNREPGVVVDWARNLLRRSQ